MAKECEHIPVVIKEVSYDSCNGFIVWCRKCGAYSEHDEYDHEDERGNMRDPKTWTWISPEGD